MPTHDKNAPKPPPSAYFLFFQRHIPSILTQPEIQRHNGKVDMTKVAKVLSEKWREMSAEEMTPYQKMAEEMKVTYWKEKEEYDRSGGVSRVNTSDEDIDAEGYDAAQPKRPHNAFGLFYNETRPVLMQQVEFQMDGMVDMMAINLALGRMWKHMREEERAKYFNEAKRLKDEYDAEIAQKHPDRVPKQRSELLREQGALPKRPMSAYFHFAKDKRAALEDQDRFRTSRGTKNILAITSELAKMWKESSEEEKAKYQAEARREKEQYDAEMAQYLEKQKKIIQTLSAPRAPLQAQQEQIRSKVFLCTSMFRPRKNMEVRRWTVGSFSDIQKHLDEALQQKEKIVEAVTGVANEEQRAELCVIPRDALVLEYFDSEHWVVLTSQEEYVEAYQVFKNLTQHLLMLRVGPAKIWEKYNCLKRPKERSWWRHAHRAEKEERSNQEAPPGYSEVDPHSQEANPKVNWWRRGRKSEKNEEIADEVPEPPKYDEEDSSTDEEMEEGLTAPESTMMHLVPPTMFISPPPTQMQAMVPPPVLPHHRSQHVRRQQHAGDHESHHFQSPHRQQGPKNHENHPHHNNKEQKEEHVKERFRYPPTPPAHTPFGWIHEKANQRVERGGRIFKKWLHKCAPDMYKEQISNYERMQQEREEKCKKWELPPIPERREGVAMPKVKQEQREDADQHTIKVPQVASETVQSITQPEAQQEQQQEIAPPEAPVPAHTLFPDGHQLLHSMGFTNWRLNEHFLIHYRGNVADTVASLIKLQNS